MDSLLIFNHEMDEVPDFGITNAGHRICSSRNRSVSNKPDIYAEAPVEAPIVGISLEGVRQFIEKCGGRCELQSLTTSEVCYRYVRPITAENQSSYIEYLQCASKYSRMGDIDTSWQKEIVGKANLFISHAWRYEFLAVMDSIERHIQQSPSESEECFIWFDLFTNNQHISNTATKTFTWWSTTFQKAIEVIGRLLLVMLPHDNPLVFTRVWCIWEIYCAYVTGCKVEMCMSQDEIDRYFSLNPSDYASISDCALNLTLQLEHVMSNGSIVDSNNVKTNKFYSLNSFARLVNSIDIQTADSQILSDKENILATIQSTVGYHSLNSCVIDCVRNWMIRVCNQKLDDVKAMQDNCPTKSCNESFAIKEALADIYVQAGRLDMAMELYEECFRHICDKDCIANDTHYKISECNNCAIGSTSLASIKILPQANTLINTVIQNESQSEHEIQHEIPPKNQLKIHSEVKIGTEKLIENRKSLFNVSEIACVIKLSQCLDQLGYNNKSIELLRSLLIQIQSEINIISCDSEIASNELLLMHSIIQLLLAKGITHSRQSSKYQDARHLLVSTLSQLKLFESKKEFSNQTNKMQIFVFLCLSELYIQSINTTELAVNAMQEAIRLLRAIGNNIIDKSVIIVRILTGIFYINMSWNRFDICKHIAIYLARYCREKYGPDSSQALTALSNLATVYYRLGSSLSTIQQCEQHTQFNHHSHTKDAVACRIEELDCFVMSVIDTEVVALNSTANICSDPLSTLPMLFDSNSNKATRDTISNNHNNWQIKPIANHSNIHYFGLSEELLRLVYSRRTVSLGQNHIKTLVALNNLSIVLAKLGEYSEAEELLMKCVRSTPVQTIANKQVLVSDSHSGASDCTNDTHIKFDDQIVWRHNLLLLNLKKNLPYLRVNGSTDSTVTTNSYFASETCNERANSIDRVINRSLKGLEELQELIQRQYGMSENREYAASATTGDSEKTWTQAILQCQLGSLNIIAWQNTQQHRKRHQQSHIASSTAYLSQLIGKCCGFMTQSLCWDRSRTSTPVKYKAEFEETYLLKGIYAFQTSIATIERQLQASNNRNFDDLSYQLNVEGQGRCVAPINQPDSTPVEIVGSRSFSVGYHSLFRQHQHLLPSISAYTSLSDLPAYKQLQQQQEREQLRWLLKEQLIRLSVVYLLSEHSPQQRTQQRHQSSAVKAVNKGQYKSSIECIDRYFAIHKTNNEKKYNTDFVADNIDDSRSKESDCNHNTNVGDVRNGDEGRDIIHHYMLEFIASLIRIYHFQNNEYYDNNCDAVRNDNCNNSAVVICLQTRKVINQLKELYEFQLRKYFRLSDCLSSTTDYDIEGPLESLSPGPMTAEELLFIGNCICILKLSLTQLYLNSCMESKGCTTETAELVEALLIWNELQLVLKQQRVISSCYVSNKYGCAFSESLDWHYQQVQSQLQLKQLLRSEASKSHTIMITPAPTTFATAASVDIDSDQANTVSVGNESSISCCCCCCLYVSMSPSVSPSDDTVTAGVSVSHQQELQCNGHMDVSLKEAIFRYLNSLNMFGFWDSSATQRSISGATSAAVAEANAIRERNGVKVQTPPPRDSQYHLQHNQQSDCGGCSSKFDCICRVASCCLCCCPCVLSCWILLLHSRYLNSAAQIQATTIT